MGIGSIGIPGLVLILIIALVLFGPSKLPELGRAFGTTLKEFKEGTRKMIDDEEQDQDDTKDKDAKRLK